MKKYIFYILTVSMLGTTGCADTLTGVINSTIEQAKTLAKDKLGDIAGDVFGNTTSATINTPFQLKYGQTASITSEDLKIKFDSITEDSPCASDVQCIQAGRFTASLILTKSGTSLGTFNISLDPGNAASATQYISNYIIRLNSVDPSSFTSTGKPSNTSYSINLTLNK